jgi:hypothetical protein
MHVAAPSSSTPAALASVSNGLVRGPLQWFTSATPPRADVAGTVAAPSCTPAAAGGLVRTQDRR